MYGYRRVAFSCTFMIAAMVAASSSALAQSSASSIKSDFTVQVNAESAARSRHLPIWILASRTIPSPGRYSDMVTPQVTF